jgi:hypothetical protein
MEFVIRRFLSYIRRPDCVKQLSNEAVRYDSTTHNLCSPFGLSFSTAPWIIGIYVDTLEVYLPILQLTHLSF